MLCIVYVQMPHSHAVALACLMHCVSSVACCVSAAMLKSAVYISDVADILFGS